MNYLIIVALITLIIFTIVFEVATTLRNSQYAKENCNNFCKEQNKTLIKRNGRFCRCKYEFLEQYLNES